VKVREKSKIYDAVQYTGRPLSPELTSIIDGVDSIAFQGNFVLIRQRAKLLRVQLTEWILRATDGILYTKSDYEFKRDYEVIK